MIEDKYTGERKCENCGCWFMPVRPGQRKCDYCYQEEELRAEEKYEEGEDERLERL